MINTFEQEWKSAAANVAQTNDDIEKAFLDQAYGLIANKASPIMKSPYRMGFEIVHKNDDNTRMVGIFVFRVNKDLFYAPVFFLNGSIKGTDLFYRASIKRFVPLTQDWVEYLVNLAEHQEGHGVPITYRSQLRNQLNMREIVHPPNSAYKYASDHGAAIKEASAETRAAVTEMEKLCDLEQGILKRFIVEDGGFDAMRKIANTAQRDFAFARALVECCDVDSYRPALEATVKVAGVVEQHEVLTANLILNSTLFLFRSDMPLNQVFVLQDFVEADVRARLSESSAHDPEFLHEKANSASDELLGLRNDSLASLYGRDAYIPKSPTLYKAELRLENCRALNSGAQSRCRPTPRK